ncbi:hypothetical protein L226DRAFT_257525 [Lentinus tigrinus ALCF2SS1-7]|uniref:Uncharacterized protein n=1 Tax=Lentinus tigrinus ALCF2SS1-6 TaxID=1328759 RepID=A0A5C2RU34_9APHY|nr:hypothetical protein L227DRAFT_311445 [Lentinus tigrinus ALCF2SS1-6]RPD70119.1 hypothetical protein L226DRAFT_257525 [Lentinus tigrinus ALCF2SS1-7]
MSPQYVWKNTANPTSMNRIPSEIRNVQRFAPELIGLVLSHTHGDIATLKACSLVCSAWASEARRVLLRKVVVRPAMPSHTWNDFFQLLSASHEVAGYIRRLTFCGPDKIAEQQAQTDHLSEALERLPSLTELCIKNGMFGPFERSSKAVSGADCQVNDLAPFHQLFTHFDKVETLVLHGMMADVCQLERLPRLAEGPMRQYVRVRVIPPELPPPLAVCVGTIQADRVRVVLPSNKHRKEFYQFLRRSFSPPAAGLSVSTRLVEGPDELSELLDAFDRDVRSVSINVLLISCDLDNIVAGRVKSGWNRRFYISFKSFTSIRELVLYFTTTSVMVGRHAVRLYRRNLANNWSVLSNAPRSLTNIELRFQRYGLHMPHVLDDLRVLEGVWGAVDERTIQRFPHLEAFTCILCDEGFIDHFSPFKYGEPFVPAPESSVTSRQQEFDDYAALLRGFLPRLHERGLLRFEMSDV